MVTDYPKHILIKTRGTYAFESFMEFQMCSPLPLRVTLLQSTFQTNSSQQPGGKVNVNLPQHVGLPHKPIISLTTTTHSIWYALPTINWQKLRVMSRSKVP